ncbi:MAG: PAS domain S-box protein [Halothece sp.]
MICQQLLNRINLLSEKLDHCDHLDQVCHQLAAGKETHPRQLQDLLQQERQQRKRLSSELKILTRQLDLALKLGLQSNNDQENDPARPHSPQHSLTGIFNNSLAREKIAKAKELALVRQMEADQSRKVQQALAMSEKTWRALFNQSFQLMALLDGQGQVRDLNQRALELVQGELEPVLGSNFWEIPWWHEADRHQIKQSIKLAKGGGIIRFEVALQPEQGEAIPIDLSLKGVWDESNQVVMLIAEGRDLRDRVNKEAELRREKEISDSIIKSLPGVFYILRQNGPCTRCNQELEKITGYTRDEIEDMDFLELFISSDQVHVEDQIQEAFTKGKSTTEATFLSKDNQKTTCYLSHVPLSLDNDHNYLLGIGIDITETKQVKNERQKLASLVENSQDLISLTTLDGQVQLLNPAGEEILGLDLKNAQLPLLLKHCFSPSSEQYFDQEIFPCLFKTGQWYGELELQNYQTGAVLPVLANIFVIRDSQTGIPMNFGVITRNISTRKQTEIALKNSEQRFRSIFEQAAVGIALLDMSGRFKRINHRGCEILGYPQQELLTRSYQDLIDLEQLADNNQLVQQLIRRKINTFSREQRYQGKDGNWVWVNLTMSMMSDSEQESASLLAIIEDISDRKTAEAALQKSEEELRTVINTVPGLVSWVSREGYYLGVNQQLATTLGLQPKDFVGKEIGFLHRSSSFVRFMYEFLASGENETSQVIESRIKNGETRSFLMAAQKYRQATAAVLIGIDITERKQAELALKESENQFRQLAENIEQVFWMVDLREKCFIYVSPAYESTWGRSVESVYENPNAWLEAVHPNDYESVLLACGKQIHGKYDQEYRIIRPDGEIRWIHDRAFPVKDDKGRAYRIAGIAEDITERKRSKEALKRREHYLKALVGVQRRLLASRVDESLYREVLAILGDACEASRIYVYENAIDENGQVCAQECAEWQMSHACSLSNGERPIFDYESLGEECYEQLQCGEFIQKTVAELPEAIQPFFQERQIVSFLMIPLIINGEFFGVIGFDNCQEGASFGRLEVGLLSSAAAAIAFAKEKQLTQETLQQQLTAIETATDGIMIIDTLGHLHYVNPAYCQMLGYESANALLETPWSRHHPAGEIPRIREEILPKLQTEGYWSGEICGQRKDASTFIQELSMNLTENGEIVGVCRDISQRKEAEDQLKASLEEKELLLKEVHHRVKNNLQVISSIFSLQSQAIEDEKALALLEESQNRISSMSLIHEKLYQAANLTNIDFAEYIRDLAHHLLASYNVNPDWIQTEMNIESIPMNLDSAIPCGLLINELISNSLKHGFPNERRGRIYIFLGLIDEETLCLKVEDNGVGLPEDFNPSQATSLGISLITSLTQQLRGRLKFQNNPGASFEITFPKPIERKRF